MLQVGNLISWTICQWLYCWARIWGYVLWQGNGPGKLPSSGKRSASAYTYTQTRLSLVNVYSMSGESNQKTTPWFPSEIRLLIRHLFNGRISNSNTLADMWISHKPFVLFHVTVLHTHNKCFLNNYQEKIKRSSNLKRASTILIFDFVGAVIIKRLHNCCLRKSR